MELALAALAGFLGGLIAYGLLNLKVLRSLFAFTDILEDFHSRLTRFERKRAADISADVRGQKLSAEDQAVIAALERVPRQPWWRTHGIKPQEDRSRSGEAS